MMNTYFIDEAQMNYWPSTKHALPSKNNRQVKTEHLNRKTPEMRIEKSALRVISTNELASMTVEKCLPPSLLCFLLSYEYIHIISL